MGRKEIEERILESNPCLMRRYYRTEIILLKPADGVEEILKYLISKRYSLNVVSDMSAIDVIVNFLNTYNLRHYFRCIYSPGGVIRETGEIDRSFSGVSKEDGSIYEKLRSELEKKGIDVGEAVMIGDNPVKDIEMAKKYGFTTVHYSPGKEPSPEADYAIRHFSELREVL